MRFLFFGKKKHKEVQDVASHGVAVIETVVETPQKKFFVIRFWNGIRDFPVFFKETFLRLGAFIVLLLFYVIVRGSLAVYHRSLKLFRKGSNESSEIVFSRLYAHIEKFFRIERRQSIDRISLIGIAIRNMKMKKTRTIITVGGMALGIASIVFLVSIGYGVQRLVISQVARLDEMRQADVSPQAGGKVKINDETIAAMKDMPNVDAVAPLVAVVGKVNYQGSVSDMAVYAVTSGYLRQSAIQPSSGTIFESDELSSVFPETKTVAGVTNEKKTYAYGDIAYDVTVRGVKNVWVRLRESPDSKSRVAGYARISDVPQVGQAVVGKSYGSPVSDAGEAYHDDTGEAFGKWISIEAALWEPRENCSDSDVSDGCDDAYKPVLDAKGDPRIEQGYFALVDETIAVTEQATSPNSGGAVLGESTTTDTATPAPDDGIKVSSSDGEWVEIADIDGEKKTESDAERVMLGDAAKRQAVVNRAMLRVLALPEEQAVGQKFSVSFVVTGNLLEEKKKVESVESEYTIVGVVPDDKTPVFYAPFIDIRTLGISNYSQLKVTTANQDVLPNIRRQVEGMGYATASVSDTVEQINNFFSTARIVLSLLGMAALGVAALGMFNTLTVSLLERTREVGLMKAMGMKASEVQELFLTESMVMAFFGGIFGLFFGFLAGKLLGLGISTLAFLRDKNMGVLDISYIPSVFVVTILIFSVTVGILTGLYPARRATKISALNALRYE